MPGSYLFNALFETQFEVVWQLATRTKTGLETGSHDRILLFSSEFDESSLFNRRDEKSGYSVNFVAKRKGKRGSF